MPKQTSVTDAKKLQESGSTYIDVRSTAEYASGHPDGAVNVPLMERDESGQMAPNPEFLRVIRANFAPDARILVGCQMGGRSARAAQMLESVGYTNVTNVRGGFGGMKDPMGRTIDPGWEESDLPIEREEPAGRSYRDLAAKADSTQ